MSGLIWVQSVCNGYEQTTLVGKELNKANNKTVFFSLTLLTYKNESYTISYYALIFFVHQNTYDNCKITLNVLNFLTLIVFLKEFFETVDFEKNQQLTKNMLKLV